MVSQWSLLTKKGLHSTCPKIKETYPEKDIWCFTGYDFEKDIIGHMYNECPETKELLSYIDVLVDGPFIEAQKNLNLVFRGSENQRLIRIPETLKTGNIVLWEKKCNLNGILLHCKQKFLPQTRCLSYFAPPPIVQ